MGDPVRGRDGWASEVGDDKVADARVVREPTVADAQTDVQSTADPLIRTGAVEVVGDHHLRMDAESREAAGHSLRDRAHVVVDDDGHGAADGVGAASSGRVP